MTRKRFSGKEMDKLHGNDLCREDALYLRDLAEALMHIPVMYGTDQGDTDILTGICRKILRRVENEGNSW